MGAVPLSDLSSPLSDARTTPRWARLPTLIGLGGLLLYFLLGVRSSLTSLGAADPMPVLEEGRDWLWLARWRMFTELRPTHTALRARARNGDAWRELDLALLYPSRWQEGPGYNRGSFWKDSDRLEQMAADLCRRARPDPAEIRLALERWPKTPGSAEQPAVDVETRVLLERPCERRR